MRVAIPMTGSLAYRTATEALERFRSGDLSPVELVRALIERLNPTTNAFTGTFFERVLEQARRAEARYRSRASQPRALEGVAVAIKDGNPVAGEPTTCGSRLYRDHRPARTHPGVERLLSNGAILLGRTTMPEFGEAANCYSPLWGVTRNPWNPMYGPGGSSGGAGAALAAGMSAIDCRS